MLSNATLIGFILHLPVPRAMLLRIFLLLISFLGLVLSNSFRYNEILSSPREIANSCSNDTARDHLMSVLDEFNTFLTENFNLTHFDRATESGKKYALQQLFRDQCRKKFDYIKRINAVNVTLQACAREDKISAVETGSNVLIKSVEYICYKNGKRLALFFQRSGYECLTDNTQTIQQCNTDVFDDNTFLKCKEYRELQSCIVDAILNCDVLTPVNMVHAFMKNIYLQLPCNKAKIL